MVNDISDRKPGLSTAFLALLIMLLAAVVVVGLLTLLRRDNTYDTDRSVRRVEKLQILNKENEEKSAAYAVIDKDKGIYQLPIKDAMALTVRDLANKVPQAAYPMAAPAGAVPPATGAEAKAGTKATEVVETIKPSAPAPVTAVQPASSLGNALQMPAPAEAAPASETPTSTPAAMPSSTP